MWQLIEELKPPGYKKKNRGAIYRLIARVAERLANDGEKALQAFFPLTANSKTVALHGKALSIPHFPFDTEEAYQNRVATAAFYLERQGMRGFIAEFLDQLVGGRYQLLEYPFIGFRVGYSPLGSSLLGGGTRLFIKVRGLTSQEEEWIRSFLDASLDPDVEIHIIAWVYNPVPPAGIELLRRLGGAGWLKRQLEDICNVKAELLPDDCLRFGHARLGYASLIATLDPVVVVRASDPASIPAIGERLAEILESSINRRCF